MPEWNLQYQTVRNVCTSSEIELYAWYNKCLRDMASCEYGQIAGGTCGCSMDNPAKVTSVVIAKCTKDIRGHLRSQNVRDASVDSESKLLLARAGMYFDDLTVLINRIGKRFVTFFLRTVFPVKADFLNLSITRTLDLSRVILLPRGCGGGKHP